MDGIAAKLQFEQQLKDMGFDISKISNIVELVNNDAMCGPECQRQKKLAELRDAMTAAKKATEDAPINLEEARKKYFLYKDGEKGYMDAQLNERRKEAVKKVGEMKTEFDKRVQRTQTLIDEYEGMWAYNENIDDLMGTYTTTNQRLKKEIDDTKAKTFTNDRRFYYYDQAIGWQWYINKLAQIGYWLVVVGYIVYYLFYKGHYNNRNSLAYGVGLIVLPFVITYIFTMTIMGYSIQGFLDRIANAIIGYI